MMKSRCTESETWKEALKRRIKTQAEAAVQRRQVYLLDPKRCYCGAIISFERRNTTYCSRKCSVTVNNQKRRVLRYCNICQKMLQSTQLKTCSRKCYFENYAAITLLRFERGEISCAETLRKVLLQLHPHQCQDCNLCIWKNQPVPLDVDHIDGNSENNMPFNLRLLCKNCHGLTPTFGNRNKGHGRKTRYKA